VSRAPGRTGTAPREHAVPELRAVLGHGQQLAAVLARVAGAVDHALHAVDLASANVNGFAAAARGARSLAALHGEQRVLVRDVAHVRPGISRSFSQAKSASRFDALTISR
jgi:hypothetical protein